MVTHQLVLLAAMLSGCAPKPQSTIPIAVLVDGDHSAVGALPKTAVPGLELRSIALPSLDVRAPDPSGGPITQARSLYAKGDFDACRAEIAKVDPARLLAARERGLAARALVIDAACAWGALDKSAARAIAARIASYGLELPDLVVSPDVERVIGDALTAAGKATRVPQAITGEIGARLSIDGRDGCALPCTVDVTPGEHVLAVEADGFQPAIQMVRASEAAQLAIAQQPAAADLAARQWRARVGRGQPATDVTGAALLGKFAKESRVAFVHGDKQLTGALVVDGKLVASATREPGGGATLVRELAYDGGVLERPAIWQRPLFWIVTSGAVALIAGVVIAITYEPDKRTRLVVP